MKKIYINCPLCNKSNYKILFNEIKNIDDPKKLYSAANGLQGYQTIVKCKECEFIYENPRYPETIILEGYKNANNEGHDSQFDSRVNSFYKALVKNKKFLPNKNKTKILDIGTASGAFLVASNKFGYDSYGIEPSLSLTELSKSRGLNVINCTINDLKRVFGSQKFDLITLWDVLEHVVNPKETLLELNSFLNEDGKILINYPEIDSIFFKIFKDKYWWIISVHLHHFTEATLKKMISRCGYKFVSCKKYFQKLELGYLLKMAVHYKLPFSNIIEKYLPHSLKKINIPYYAYQKTFICKKR